LRATHFQPLRLLFAASLWLAAAAAGAADDVPPRGSWATRAPAAAGFDPVKLAAAVDLARQKTVAEPQDLRQVILDH
jgi:hypothetical protein